MTARNPLGRVLWSVFLMMVAANNSVDAHKSHRSPESLYIPKVLPSERRPITTNDLISLRDIDSLSLSPDGKQLAILVRQADPIANSYRTAWFVGSTRGGSLSNVGDGGEARFIRQPTGDTSGEIGGTAGRWSPNGKWIAYLVKNGDEVQIWSSRADGRVRRQVSRNSSDVQEFAWSRDGRTIYFQTESPRTEVSARDETERRIGVPLNSYQSFIDIASDHMPPRVPEAAMTAWAVDENGDHERRARGNELEKLRQELSGDRSKASGFSTLNVEASNGARAWLENTGPSGSDGIVRPTVRLTVSFSVNGENPIHCEAHECVGDVFSKIWWTADGKSVIGWRNWGPNQTEQLLFRWTPATGVVTPLFRSSTDYLQACEVIGDQAICLRETPTQPRHVALIDLKSGRVEVVADVNPEFANIRLGRVEQIEWKLPADKASLGYSETARGSIIYPTNFDPSHKYPVFISPYRSSGFKRGDVGDEQPLFVYAANGFVVINSEAPYPWGAVATSNGVDAAKKAYSAELGFPHLTMVTESAFGALDAATSRGGIDLSRVGVGGVSQGADISYFMLQKYDRISAISVGSPDWSQAEYYVSTKYGRTPYANQAGGPNEWPEDPGYWAQIDLADHVDAVAAPILFNLAEREAFMVSRLLRRLDNANKPYDAYIFLDEYHVKWQPAHRLAIYNRNLDWFRFWLQGQRDLDPAKAEQYRRWEQLCDQQREIGPNHVGSCLASKGR